VVTDQTGIVEVLDYMPYGSLRFDNKVGSYQGEKRKFANSEQDSLSGHNYMQQRFEDPLQGRFISQDPMFVGDPNYQKLTVPQSLNAYSYAEGNPVTKSDPDGRYAETAFDVAMLAYSTNEYHNNPSLANAAAMGLDGLSVATPFVPAIGGILIRSAEKAVPRVAQVVKNAVDGARREAEVYRELQQANPGADVLKQPYLRDASGKRAIDPRTGEARRIDNAVVQDGKVVDRVEVTSQRNFDNGGKRNQIDKEQRIINNGGTYIRGTDGKLINFANPTGGVTTPSRVITKP
jgi:RHS repeat-associated protein